MSQENVDVVRRHFAACEDYVACTVREGRIVSGREYGSSRLSWLAPDSVLPLPPGAVLQVDGLRIAL